MSTDLSLPEKKMFKMIELFLCCSLCQSQKIRSLAEAVTCVQAWRGALSSRYSLVVGQIVLLGSVKKKKGEGEEKECLFKNPSANEGVMKSPGLCTQSPFF